MLTLSILNRFSNSLRDLLKHLWTFVIFRRRQRSAYIITWLFLLILFRCTTQLVELPDGTSFVDSLLFWMWVKHSHGNYTIVYCSNHFDDRYGITSLKLFSGSNTPVWFSIKLPFSTLQLTFIMARGGIIVNAATPTRHTIGVCFCMMGVLDPLTTNEFVLKSTMQLLTWMKSALSNSSCAKSLDTYTVCCVVIPSRLISNTVVPRTSSGLLLAPRIGWCIRRNVLALVLILLKTSLCIIVTAAQVSTNVLTSMLLKSHRMNVAFSVSLLATCFGCSIRCSGSGGITGVAVPPCWRFPNCYLVTVASAVPLVMAHFSTVETFHVPPGSHWHSCSRCSFHQFFH